MNPSQRGRREENLAGSGRHREAPRQSLGRAARAATGPARADADAAGVTVPRRGEAGRHAQAFT